jgi:hypothetical protein
MSQIGSYASTAGGAPVLTLTGDAGGAISPVVGNINLLTGVGTTTTGAGNTITITLDAATTVAIGGVYLATNAETRTGTDTTKCVTPDDLNYKLGTQTQYGLPIGNASTGSLQWTAAPSDGQLLIGATGATAALQTITAGTGISVTNGAHSITINSTGGGLTWSREASSPVVLVVNHGYIQANATPATIIDFYTPATASLGDTIEIIGENAGGWKINQGNNQAIQFGNVATTTGIGGSLSSSNRYDCVTLKCRVAGASTIWVVTSSVGVLTVV